MSSRRARRIRNTATFACVIVAAVGISQLAGFTATSRDAADDPKPAVAEAGAPIGAEVRQVVQASAQDDARIELSAAWRRHAVAGTTGYRFSYPRPVGHASVTLEGPAGSSATCQLVLHQLEEGSDGKQRRTGSWTLDTETWTAVAPGSGQLVLDGAPGVKATALAASDFESELRCRGSATYRSSFVETIVYP